MHHLLPWVMDTLKNGGYLGIVLLMALESSVVPIPSELVIPPAAYWASQGQLSLAGVLLAGALGGWIGLSINYWLSFWVGRPIVLRYGRYFLVSPEKLRRRKFGSNNTGIAGHLLLPPAPRRPPPHLHPGGIVPHAVPPLLPRHRHRRRPLVLRPRLVRPPRHYPRELLTAQDNTRLIEAVEHQTHWILLLVVLLIVLYTVMQRFLHKHDASTV